MPMLLPLASLLSLLFPAPVPSIPEARAQLLDGTPVNLPADLRGRTTVLVIGFSQGSREQVAAWGERLAPDYRDAPDVSYYQVAELEDVPRLLRGYVLKKIKETVPARVQPHFLAVTDHEAEWKSIASFGAKDEAYVLLLDPAGRVRSTAHGVPSDLVYTALKHKVDSLRKQP